MSGHPPGRGDRDPQPVRRRVSDVPKPTCPWCGASTSIVYRSQRRGSPRSDTYQRRRRCEECGRDWPTVEGLDLERFERELAGRGLTLADLGITVLR